MNETEEITLKAFSDFLTMVESACVETKQKIGQITGATQTATMKEETFNGLSYEKQQGSRLGEYETAGRNSSQTDKWTSAFNVLKQNGATINNRYHGEGYAYSYWLYGEDRIYRQRLARAQNHERP
jgi:hypothetical protein